MPRVNCSGIKSDGCDCVSKAKAGSDRCGTHSHDKYGSREESENFTKLQLIKRFKFMVTRADFLHRIQLHEEQFLLQQTHDQLRTIIRQGEELIRQDYPGFTGTFTKNLLYTFTRLRVGNNQLLAEHRCIVVGHQAQIPLMHEWYAFAFINLNVVFPEITLALLYDVDYIRNVFAPRFGAQYHLLPVHSRGNLERCFLNLNVLGQGHITRLRDFIPIEQAAAAANQAGAAFIHDNQNVHRARTVSHVTRIFNKLMEIVVPRDQTTLGSIIVKCKLPPRAIIHLTQHYCEPVTIYEIPRAYPRALDAVWAFIEAHPEKEELYVRVRDEMTDNIGMCAQGNLSRVCNIVSGYIEGIQPAVAQGEILQNKMAAIAGDSEGDKVGRAKKVLQELYIPEDQWAPWIEAFD